MELHAYITVAMAAVLFALYCILKRIDERIDELQILVHSINDWVYNHNRLNKIMLKKAQELEEQKYPEPLKPEISD